MVDPGFLLCEVAFPPEVGAGAEVGEAHVLEFRNHALHGAADSGTGLPLHRQGLIHDLRLIGPGGTYDLNGAAERAVAGIVALELMPLDDSLFLEDQGQAAHIGLRAKDRSTSNGA